MMDMRKFVEGVMRKALEVLVIMLLWNELLPRLFGLTNITYWEAFGLSIICSFLFKSSIENKKGKE